MPEYRTPHQIYLFSPGERVDADVPPGWIRVTELLQVRDKKPCYLVEREFGRYLRAMWVNAKGRECRLAHYDVARRIGEFTVGYRRGFQKLLAADRKRLEAAPKPISRLGVEFEPLIRLPRAERNGLSSLLDR
jgi:hypothetical protein